MGKSDNCSRKILAEGGGRGSTIFSKSVLFVAVIGLDVATKKNCCFLHFFLCELVQSTKYAGAVRGHHCQVLFQMRRDLKIYTKSCS